jgi:hypothetical protein
MPHRTTMRTRSGAKLYVRRTTSGQFADAQTHKRALGSDIKRRSQAEATQRSGKAKAPRRNTRAR